MQRKKLTRLLALLLSSTMIISVTACGKDNTGNNETQNQVAQNQGENETSDDGNSDDELEPITLTFGVLDTRWSNGGGVFTDKYPALEYIKEQLGIELDFVTYDADKLTTLIAGGDLPDVFSLEVSSGANTIIPNLISADQLVEMGDLLEQYGSNIVGKQEPAIAYSKATFGEGEKVYGIPTCVALPTGQLAYSNGCSFRVRYDVWEAIGSPEPSTPDELIEMLKEMQEYERNRLGQDDIYGMSLLMLYDLWNVGTYAMCSGYYYSSSVKHLVNLVDGEVEATFANPDGVMWEALEFFNKAYREGILDPESLTQDVGAHDNKFYAGKALSCNHWDKSVDKETLESEKACLPAMPLGQFTMLQGVGGLLRPTGDGYLVMSSNCEYPERAMQLINMLYDDEYIRYMYNGEYGVDWEYDEEGNPQFIGELADAFAQDEAAGWELYNEKSLNSAGAYWFGGNVDIPSLDGKLLSATDSDVFKDMTDDGTVSPLDIFAQDYGFEKPNEVYSMWVEEGRATTDSQYPDVISIITVMGQPSEETELIAQEAMNYFNANIAKVVYADTAEEFEENKNEMIDYVKKLGIEEYDAEIKTLWEQAEALFNAGN